MILARQLTRVRPEQGSKYLDYKLCCLSIILHPSIHSSIQQLTQVPFTCIFIRPFTVPFLTYLYTCPPIHISIHPPIHGPFVSVDIHPSIHPSMYPSSTQLATYPYVYPLLNPPFIRLNTYLRIHPPAHSFIPLSIHPFNKPSGFQRTPQMLSLWAS